MKKAIYTLLFLISVTLNGQQKTDQQGFKHMLNTLLSHKVKTVSPEDCNTTDIVFLDTRAQEEYKVSHINNALWCDYNSFKIKHLKNIDKNAKIVVYCTVGYRSEKIGEKLQRAGFTNVSNLYGGIFAWATAGKTLYNANGKTNNIHTYNKDWAKWLTTGNAVYNSKKTNSNN